MRIPVVRQVAWRNEQRAKIRLTSLALATRAEIKVLKFVCAGQRLERVYVEPRFRRAYFQAMTRGTAQPVQRTVKLQQRAEPLRLVTIKSSADFATVVRKLPSGRPGGLPA